MAFNAFGVISEDELQAIYAFGSHQYALYFWAKSMNEGRIPKNSTLVHIDFHSDFLNPDNRLITPTTPQQVDRLIRERVIRYDNFIKSAIKIGIVKDVVFCCKPKSGDFNDFGKFKNYVSPIKIVELLRSYKEKAPLPKAEKLLCEQILDGALILDIDLDFFVDFNAETIRLKDDALIIKEVSAINAIFQHSKTTTICTSHDWSWEDTQRSHVQMMFSNHFVGKVSFDNEPDLIYGFHS